MAKKSESRAEFITNYDLFDSLLPLSCQNCGSKEHTVIHHIVPLVRGGRNALGNLSRLCGDCHALAHGQSSNMSALMKAGKEYARKHNPNFKDGRPKRVLTEQHLHAIELLETNTYKVVEAKTGLSKSTLQRIKRQYKAEQEQKE